MPVTAASSLASRPLLLDKDRLSLHGHIILVPEGIIDTALSATHQIDKQAQQMLQHLEQGATYSTITNGTTSLSEAHRAQLLGFLNSVGGLRVRRRIWQKWRSLLRFLYYWCLGIRFSTLYRRFAATFCGIIAGVGIACLPVATAVGGVATLLWCGGLTTITQSYVAAGCVSALLVVSVATHEYAHLVCVRRCGASAIVLQHGLRIGVIHTVLSKQSEIITAVVGPIVGILFCSFSSMLAFRTEHYWLAWSSLAIALTHLGALLPWYGDGKSVQRALKGGQYA